MTDVPLAPAEPEGGWARTPRPPLTVVLTADQGHRLGSVALRATQLTPLLTRLAIAVLLGVLLGWAQAVRIGLVVGLVFAVLALVLARLAVRRVRSFDLTGSTRTTGYDEGGRFAFAGTTVTPLPAGWAKSVEHRDGITVLRPRARRTAPVVLVDELVTPEDEVFLTTPGRG